VHDTLLACPLCDVGFLTDSWPLRRPVITLGPPFSVLRFQSTLHKICPSARTARRHNEQQCRTGDYPATALSLSCVIHSDNNSETTSIANHLLGVPRWGRGGAQSPLNRGYSPHPKFSRLECSVGDSLESSGIQLAPPKRTRHIQDSFVVCLAWRCELALTVRSIQ